MSSDSSIEWTDATWNPTTGCTRASHGCDQCYAVTMTHRLEAMGRPEYVGLTVKNKHGYRHFNGVVRCHEDRLTIPLRWRKPRMVFVDSMSDLFHRDVPFDFVDKVFGVMAAAGRHTFQVLTKRPERMAEYLGGLKHDFGRLEAGARASGRTLKFEGIPLVPWPIPNIWVGTSTEDQAAFDERAPHLLRCDAAIRFLSCEPLLGSIDITGELWGRAMPCDVCPRDADCECGYVTRQQNGEPYIGWVIVGGESGPARVCNVADVAGIVRDCQTAGVPVFVKQLGSRPMEPCECEGEPWYDVPGGMYKSLRPLNLKSKKGGDITEWPTQLRVREMPEIAHA